MLMLKFRYETRVSIHINVADVYGTLVLEGRNVPLDFFFFFLDL